MNFKLLLFLLLFPLFALSQTTKVEGTVTDAITGEVMPFVTVRFQNAKVGAITDTLGKYSIETYYATDSLVFSFSGYLKVTTHVELDKAQVIDVMLPILTANYEEVVVKAPDEFPSTLLHKKVIANKPINNKEKLEAYEYEVYNKIQLDINNLNDKFEDRGIVKRLDLITNYLDSADDGTNFLPVILSESVSDYYFKKNPKKKETIK